MRFGGDFFHDMTQHALLIDYEGNAVNAFVFLAHEFLHCPYTVGIGNGVIFIGKQVEIQFITLNEFLQALGCIRADTQHHGIERLELSTMITDTAGLRGAAWCHGFRIKVQNHPAATQAVEGNGVAVLVRCGKCRCGFVQGREFQAHRSPQYKEYEG